MNDQPETLGDILAEALAQQERRNTFVKLERQAIEDQLFTLMSRANTAFSSYRSGNSSPAFDNLQGLARDIPALLERMSTIHQRFERQLLDKAALEAAVEREALPYSFAKPVDKYADQRPWDGPFDGEPEELNYQTEDHCDQCNSSMDMSKPKKLGTMLHARGATGRVCPVLFLCNDCIEPVKS